VLLFSFGWFFTQSVEQVPVKILSKGAVRLDRVPTGYSTLAKHHHFLFRFVGGLYLVNVPIFSLLKYELTIVSGIILKAKTICVAFHVFVPSVALFYPKSGTDC
jgi:hypothetical protein